MSIVFDHDFRLQVLGNGSYKIENDFGVNTLSDYAQGPTDNLTQYGDITNDVIDSVAAYGGDYHGVYIGQTTPAVGVVLNNSGYADHVHGYYLYTNANLTYGNTFSVSRTVFDVSQACYVAGTLIRTDMGDVPVEALAIGDGVVTLSGAVRAIRWIGHRSYAGRFLSSHSIQVPICFKAGSIADAVPSRDLWVSPQHAMFLDGVLIPARHLVNGVTILLAEKLAEITYWHVELDTHDVLIAEGAPSESFVDDNSRGMFHNVTQYYALYPDAQVTEAVFCAPRVEAGIVLEAVRRRLALRAGSEGERAA